MPPRQLPSPLGVRPLESSPKNNKALRHLIYQLAGPHAERYVRMLHAIAVGRRKTPPSVQFAALVWFLERIYGKAVQPNLNLEMDATAELKEVESETLIARIAEIVEGNPRLAAALKRGIVAPPRRVIEAPGARAADEPS